MQTQEFISEEFVDVSFSDARIISKYALEMIKMMTSCHIRLHTTTKKDRYLLSRTEILIIPIREYKILGVAGVCVVYTVTLASLLLELNTMYCSA